MPSGLFGLVTDKSYPVSDVSVAEDDVEPEIRLDLLGEDTSVLSLSDLLCLEILNEEICSLDLFR